jgi:superfamily I DNA/RNA helicase
MTRPRRSSAAIRAIVRARRRQETQEAPGVRSPASNPGSACLSPPISTTEANTKPAATLRKTIAKPKSRPRRSGGHALTEEQTAIVDAAVTGNDVKAVAFAGTGKTATLAAVAEALPRRRIVYLAFNKAIATEAAQRFPRHVQAVTAHALAYRAIGHQYQSLLGQRLWARDLAEQRHYAPLFDRDPVQVASAVLDTVRRFESSAEPEIARYHVPKLHLATFTNPWDKDTFARDIVRLATRLWDDRIDPRNTTPITHDTYLKLWQLSRPRLSYGTILFDEAQDASPVMLDIVLQQTGAQRVWVGDSHQQIYAWRGAVDAMRRIDAPALPLTQSFRFGPAIADVANRLLAVKGEVVPLRGFDRIPSLLRTIKAAEIPYTMLCRTNLELVRHALAGLRAGKQVAVVGGTQDAATLLRAAHRLWRTEGSPVKPGHPLLAPFKSWGEIEQAAETEDGAELKPVVRLVDEFGDELPDVAEQLEHTYAEDRAEVIISTVHKAKGREWHHVRLADDFRSMKPGRNGEPPNAGEINLAYVAVTRAQQVLDVGGCTAVQNLLEPERYSDDDVVEW